LKLYGFNTCVIFIGVISVLGCSSSVKLRNSTAVENTEAKKISVQETAHDSLITEKTENRYENEEMVLENILQYYADAQTAHEYLDFGFAETMIDSAFVLLNNIDFASIEDDDLTLRYKDVVFALGRELGMIVHETELISKEDYTSWIDELENYDDFKNGKWTDEELRKIVMKISLKSDMPVDFNDKVIKAIHYFQTNRRNEMIKWMRRSGRYLPLVRKILAEEGLPQDLVYLSMIESGFNPKAYSRARAVGLWQFIYSTGRLYGLTRNEWVDERRDPVKATRAAARHLNDLYKMYNDWNLALAAYNWGPTRITRQVKKTPDIDFWDMNMPRETRNYVPFFMAALIISKEPDLFGFENIDYEKPFEFDTVSVHPYTSLSTMSKFAGVSVDELRDLNVELRKGRTPAGKKMYALKIPVGTKDKFLAEYAKYDPEKYTPPSVSAYRVRRGDTLSGIARKFGVRLSYLMNANNLRNANRLSVGQTLKIPGSNFSATASAKANTNVSRENATVYRIKKNDTLGTISEKFKTTVSTLQKLNRMGRRTRIYVGQTILVTGAQSANASPSKSQASSGRSLTAAIDTTPGRITYVIRKNDTLYEIAQKYGVNFKDIMRWNKITNHRTIKPGQKIIIKRTN